MAETRVEIYFGPPAWFHALLPEGVKKQNLVTLVLESDAQRRRHTISAEGDAIECVKRRRPKHVVGESSDYASINESAITNFASLIREMKPKNLYLNNPPARVRDQVKRAFNDTSEVSYTYPAFTIETLRQFRDEYDDKLVGQALARDKLLPAMYALTRADRTRPIVLMFYGPSGVGKTQTAQFINSLLNGELLRKQFSMFHSDKFASYMFGGEHGEDSLARDLLERETGVILIDEFDKANPIFHSAFYELFDTGQFVDKNYKVEVGPALIICTSNYQSSDEIHTALGDALASRFDALIGFENLTPQDVRTVIQRTVDDRLDDLDDDEKLHIDRAQLLDLLGFLAENTTNIRTLGKYIDSVVSTMLVRAVLGNADQPDAVTPPEPEFIGTAIVEAAAPPEAEHSPVAEGVLSVAPVESPGKEQSAATKTETSGRIDPASDD